MNKLKALIFDLDGTLLDTLDDLRAADNYALKKYGYPEKTKVEVRKFVGNGLGKLVSRSIPDGEDNPDYTKILDALKEYYAVHCLDETKPYEGIMELLKQVKKDYLIAIVSNKPDPQVKQLADKFFPGLIDITSGEKPGVERKPAPDTVNEVLNKLKLRTDEAIYIGDSEVDFETSVNAHLRCISVAWGFRDPDFLKEIGATDIINTPAELLTKL